MCQSVLREALFAGSVKLRVHSVKLCVRLASLSPLLTAIERHAMTNPEMTMFGQLILDALPDRDVR
jgi:hypothetical protein